MPRMAREATCSPLGFSGECEYQVRISSSTFEQQGTLSSAVHPRAKVWWLEAVSGVTPGPCGACDS